MSIFTVAKSEFSHQLLNFSHYPTLQYTQKTTHLKNSKIQKYTTKKNKKDKIFFKTITKIAKLPQIYIQIFKTMALYIY
mgnify:CR=1 FL=1